MLNVNNFCVLHVQTFLEVHNCTADMEENVTQQGKLKC